MLKIVYRHCIRYFRFFDNFFFFKILRSEVGLEPAIFALRARRLTTRPLRRTEGLQIYRLHSTMIEMTIRYAICYADVSIFHRHGHIELSSQHACGRAGVRACGRACVRVRFHFFLHREGKFKIGYAREFLSLKFCHGTATVSHTHLTLPTTLVV